MSALRTCFREALFREDIGRNPLQGIGQVNQKKREKGVFTAKELKDLFPPRGNGPWKSWLDYNVFLTAASTGMRCGELLALRWKNVDFENSVIHVTEAVKAGSGEISLPKWNRIRTVPLPSRTAIVLKKQRAKSQHVLPDAYVFCYSDGTRLGHTWWSKHFRAAMENAGIDTRARRISAHSFRHSVATILADSGYSAEKIQASLGWTNDSTRQGYTHLKADQEQAKIIDGVFGAKKEASS